MLKTQDWNMQSSYLLDATSSASDTTKLVGATATTKVETSSGLLPQKSTDRKTKITNMMKIVRAKYSEALTLLSAMKMWIQLNIPRIEDGNNFGVRVQEECMSLMIALEEKCFEILETTGKQYLVCA